MNTSASRTEASADVAAQLRDLERQGGGMARLAHVASALLLVAFSAGSLLSISHAAFVTFLARWSAGQLDVPDGISLVVNLLLVLAADVALLYAASVLRVLVAAGADAAERRVHVWAMVGASVLESTTYLYLAWQFDHPTGWFLWGIVLARAFAAPLFAAYLSMARPLPVAPRDVAYQAALASGKGVVKDVATLAADPTAPLHRKVKIYTAASLMTRTDRTRFDDIITAVSDDTPAVPQTPLQGAQAGQTAQIGVATPKPVASSDGLPTATYAPILGHSPATSDASHVHNAPPMTPTDAPPPPDTTPDGAPESPDDDPGGGLTGDAPARAAATMPPAPTPIFTPRASRRPKPAAIRARDRAAAEALEQQRRAHAYAMLDADPTTTANAIARQLRCRHATAKRYIAAYQRRQASKGA